MAGRFFLAVAICLCSTVHASVIAKSSKQECIIEDNVKNLNNTTCQTKLVVSFTISANEGKSQSIQASISRTLDVTNKKVRSVDLKQPLRIRIIKSPMIINFRLFQVGYVPGYAREEVINRINPNAKLFDCRAFWYEKDYDTNCGFAKDANGKKIFDSQGFCCDSSATFGRASSQSCASFRDTITDGYLQELEKRQLVYVGHCMVLDKLRYFVMGLYPPELHFTISIIIEQRAYLTKDGGGVWEEVSKLEISPYKRITLSNTHMIKAEYVADFYPSTFVTSEKLVHRYLLVPDISTMPSGEEKSYPDISNAEWKMFNASVNNVSEWMAINKNLFDLSGFSCNKIGVSYTAFRHQPYRCQNTYGSCLFNQPYLLWRNEKRRQRENQKGLYMLHNFGRVHSIPHTKGVTDFQLNFIADRPTKSLVVITIAADDLSIVTRVSPGRIISAFIDSFEALSSTGLLVVIVQNTGSFTATYNVYVQHCSAGIDLIPSKIITLNPRKSNNISFVIHSFHSLGGENQCELGLFDVNNKHLDNLTVSFETLDTCFCYGFCGCACGNNITTCPDAPTRANSSIILFEIKWIERFVNSINKTLDVFRRHASKLLIMFWIIIVLYCLGMLKVLHIIISGDVNMKGVSDPMIIVAEKVKEYADYIIQEWCPMVCDNCWTSIGNCCSFCCRKCCFAVTFGQVSQEENILGKRRIELGWRPPPHCDGMCKGAKYKRKIHRKMMRINKRAGIGRDIPWFQKPYNCTCKVKDAMPCVDICLGLLFFFYCPFLPVWWILEFIYKLMRKKLRKWKRIKKFRADRAQREAEKEQAYVHMDKYSRGQEEADIIKLDRDIKKLKQMEKEFQASLAGFNPELEELALEELSDKEERNVSSDNSLSDTTDPEQANDIDELVNVGHPVFFNYAIAKPNHALKNSGKSYSIKGKLTQEKSNTYHFGLHVYTFQVREVVEDTKKLLKPPKKLVSEDFKQTFEDSRQVLNLVTLFPLFTCLNGAPAKKKQNDQQ